MTWFKCCKLSTATSYPQLGFTVVRALPPRLGSRVLQCTSNPEQLSAESLDLDSPILSSINSARGILKGKMYLMYYINENGSKVYTLKKEAPDGTPTMSAHPARFSPDDKFSKQRVICKRRFGLLPTQGPPHNY